MAVFFRQEDILDTDTDYGFCPPLPSGEGWGEGIQKYAIHDRLQYNCAYLGEE